MNKTILGIDPGINGALAIITDSGIYFQDVDGSLIDAIKTIQDIKQSFPDVCAVMEAVHSMPKQGISSTFNFGKTYGHLRGALIALDIPLLAEPTPQVWKKRIFGQSIYGMDKKEQKTKARDKARELYPAISDKLKRVSDADRAEALLLAHYGLLLGMN